MPPLDAYGGMPPIRGDVQERAPQPSPVALTHSNIYGRERLFRPFSSFAHIELTETECNLLPNSLSPAVCSRAQVIAVNAADLQALLEETCRCCTRRVPICPTPAGGMTSRSPPLQGIVTIFPKKICPRQDGMSSVAALHEARTYEEMC